MNEQLFNIFSSLLLFVAAAVATILPVVRHLILGY